MVCTNCGREIGHRTTCNMCGYDPTKDAPGAVVPKNGMIFAHPSPITIRLNKKSNGMAVAGFILSFFSVIPLCGLLSLIFSLVGFFKAKYCRSGRVLAVLGLVINLLIVVFYVVATYFVLAETGAIYGY